MLYEVIKKDCDESFKARSAAKTNLLKTLLADAVNAARAKENRLPTDDEIIKLLRKYIANAELMVTTLKEKDRDAGAFVYEIEVLSAYLPAEVDLSEVTALVQELKKAEGFPTGPAGLGVAMKALKDRYAERFDGKTMTPVVKSALGI